MDFNNHVYAVWNFGGMEFWLTDTVRNTWIIGAVLIGIAVIARVKLKSFTEVPSGSQNVFELIVEAFDSFARDTMTDKYANFGRWFFGVMALILFCNLSGLFGLRPPTADLAFTFTLSLTTFFCIHFFGIKYSKGAYFKDYLSPFALFLPMNIVGEIAVPVSLSFRLFGNILGGTIIMGMVYGLLPIYLKIGLPAFLHLYFDIFAGILQSYIFVILSMTFIHQKLPE